MRKMKTNTKSLLIGISPAPIGKDWCLERIRLADDLEQKLQLPIYFYPNTWPRDELFVDCNTVKRYNPNDCRKYTHQAFHGGAFIPHKDILIVSPYIAKKQREKTAQKIGTKIAYEVPVPELFSEVLREAELPTPLKSTLAKWTNDTSKQHVDIVFNSTQNNLVTYDTTRCRQIGENIAKQTQSKLLVVPKSEVQYASVGFICINGITYVDERAEQTMSQLENAGERVKPITPMPHTNNLLGSIRCATRELPFHLEEQEAYDVIPRGVNEYAYIRTLTGTYKALPNFSDLS